jgi:hypothetical protein
MNLTTDQAFALVYNGQPNFMTPNIHKRGKRGALHYEISSGTGVTGNLIWGVTVLEVHGRDAKGRSDLHALFASRELAERYIKNDFTKD